MLTRRSAATAAALSAAALTLALPAPAYADGPADAHCGLFTCQVEAKDPGSDGKAAGGHGGGDHGSGGGGKKSKWSCTYKRADPQPPAGSLDWEGHKPGDGAVYEQTCSYGGDNAYHVIRMVWAADPPKGGVDPAVLARQAVNKMRLRGPDIGIVPKPGGKGLVGLPVWMWTAKTAEAYGPNTATASAGAVTVTATAKVDQIVWDMGDGHSVTCTTAGTPYKASYGKQSSPDCGYRYRHSSKDEPGEKYPVTATSTWTIDWRGAGQTGQLTQTRQSQTQVSIGQLKVLN
ncbi:ATP/GTP-binding protein [Streptomyces caniferus]|uniref:ATP/GTP-binding protein n=1 Tax=Streptomyces caniferus TaxID=285557 RepID=A0A640S807_9ACTN|nr:ATP/GTP-binding protein [Streptomyces caniferus]GFE07188.1 ATP/GTP-binding protein [Streptomyces caniferus]